MRDVRRSDVVYGTYRLRADRPPWRCHSARSSFFVSASVMSDVYPALQAARAWALLVPGWPASGPLRRPPSFWLQRRAWKVENYWDVLSFFLSRSFYLLSRPQTSFFAWKHVRCLCTRAQKVWKRGGSCRCLLDKLTHASLPLFALDDVNQATQDDAQLVECLLVSGKFLPVHQ